MSCCNSSGTNSAIDQAVNDALADRVTELEGYKDLAAASATDAANSATSAQEAEAATLAYRDQTQVIANQAAALVPDVLEASNNLKDVADTLEAISQTASSYTVINYYYTVVGGETGFTFPDEVNVASVQAIYIEGVRQDNGHGFTYNAGSRTVTFDEAMPDEAAGTVITVQMGQNNVDSPESVLSLLAGNGGGGYVTLSDGESVQQHVTDLETAVSDSEQDITDFKDSTDVAKGDVLIPVVQPYVGAAVRNQHVKNMETISILDFLGDSYDGTTDASGAFTSAHTLVPAGRAISIPAGTYLLNSVVNTYGRHWFLEEPVIFTGTGYLEQAVFHRYDGATGSVSIASTGVRNTDGNPQYATKFRFGGNAGNVSGFQFGGADPRHGTNGVVPFMDGYNGWLSMQPSNYPSPIELAVQPAAKAGLCTTVIGGNTVTVNSGPGLSATEVGKTVWIKDVAYTVLTVATGSFTVKLIDGSAVSFTTASQHTYVCCYIHGSGICNVNGTSITRVSGDPFIPLNNIATTFTVNGVTTTQASFTDTYNATLADSAGTASNVEYSWWGSVDNLVSAIRLHRITGAGFEENISLIAYAKAYYHLHAAGGGTDQYPIYIGSGYDADGTAKRQITIDPDNGLVCLGGSYGSASIECGYRPQSAGAVNRLRANSGTSGNPASWSAIGPDTNINMTIAAKGTGFIQTNSELRSNAAIYPNISATYTLGTAALLWSQVYASTATINTSDERLKTKLDILDAEKAAALEIKANMWKFKFNAEDEAKDGNARIHFGVGAQTVGQILTNHGLNPEDYAFYCYDKWDAQDAITDWEGNITTPAVEAGDRYGVRYEELLCFIIAAM